MMTKYFGLFFVLTSIINIDSFSFPKNSKWYTNPNQLDTKNIEQLEKIFYIKNSRYSPYKNKYTNRSIVNINITQQLIDINNKLTKNYNESIQMEEYIQDEEFNIFKKAIDDIADNNKHEDEDEIDDSTEYGYKHKNNQGEYGYIDSTGVFRYKDPKIFKQPPVSVRIMKANPDEDLSEYFFPKGNREKRGNDDSSSDGNFQVIKNSEYSFHDIGGYDKIKKELLQTADILINYEKYRKFNVRTPKGMIFEGPPGNGKTLMAKGFSGELNVSFISVSGSEFSEKYVGVGAMRVRELFKKAEENKPCIIFIDEIDALARKRGNDMVSSNSEKDQTLNQLLINLDGFKHSNGIFVIGATNRNDLLDPALVRPGRMDKNIFIGNPDSDTRKAILKIHMNGKPISPDISIDSLVEMTGGFSGAQIENLLNESMLRALRENREVITFEDLDYIINRILAGWQSTESKFSDDIIQRITLHEMGHAVVGFFSSNHAKLTKVCLNLWSPRTPGYTIFESNDENTNIYTKDGLFSHLMVLLGGRIAEELFFGYSVTTGARKDLDEAYKLAQSMIIQYGMGKQNIYPDLSDQSKFLIDQEVNDMLVLANDAALAILSESREFILDCAVILKRDQILKPEQMSEIIRTKYIDLWKKYDITRFLV